MNIVSMVLQYLAPALIGKLASGSGVSQTITEKLIKAAVPTILGALVGKAAKPDGARALFDILGKQDTGLLGRLSSVLGSPQQKTIAEQGTGILGSLFGTSSLGSLVGAISKFSGANEQQASGLIGMLAPIVLGTLSQQQKSSNLDAGGVAKLLSEQKSNISSLIPGELSKMLSGSGLLDAVIPKASASPTTASPMSISTTSSYGSTARPAAAGFNGWPWAILVGLASLLWGSLFSGPPAPWANVAAPPRLMAGATDVAGELDVALKGLHGLMSTVKDRGTAEAALPALKAAQSTIDKLSDTATKQLPLDSKRAMAGYVSSWLPVLTPVITGLIGNTGAGPVVKPVLDVLQSRLLSMTKV